MITGHTKVVALLANPSKHSMSPIIHNHAYLQDELDYVYVAFEVENIEKAINGAKALGIHGMNVSMPFKQSIIPYLDRLDQSARLSKAVNTVVLEEGKYVGYNTDGIGLWNAIEEENIHLLNASICILGSGGAAIAIVAYMAMQGVKHIVLLKRNIEEVSFVERMKEIESETGCCIEIRDSTNKMLLKETMSQSDVVIQATSVGMGQGNRDCLVEDASYFKEGSMVVDIIYNPLETVFLSLAKQRNCHCLNGLSMLLHQGAVAHTLFTHKPMPLEACRTVMEEFLCKN